MEGIHFFIQRMARAAGHELREVQFPEAGAVGNGGAVRRDVQIVYMPTFAPTSTRTSPGAKVAIHSSVTGSFSNRVSTRHFVASVGVE